MSNRALELSVRLTANSSSLVRNFAAANASAEKTGGAFRRMGRGIAGDMAKLNEAMNGWSAATRLAAEAGLSFSLYRVVAESARADKAMIRIKQTAGMTWQEMMRLRAELHRMAAETGQNARDLRAGFDDAVQSGLSFREALPVVGAVNMAMAVTGASSRALAASLTVAASAFNFDLAAPGKAVLLLDQMREAGRLGNAELEALSGIFSRVGVNAASAGMSYEKTLAFIETLSKVEKNPERLATLVDSTLRVFTNADYLKDAAKATGVRFFDKQGMRRDTVEVLKDLRVRFSGLKTDLERARFMDAAFGNADLDTQKGLRTLLGGNMLDYVSEFERKIGGAAGTLKRELPEAVANAADQTARLGSALNAVADRFAIKLNAAMTEPLAKFAADAVEKSDAMKTGTLAAAGMGALIAGRLAWKKWRGDKPGLLDSVLNRTGGVQQVFVTNWPGGLLGPGGGLKQRREQRGGDSSATAAGSPAGGAGRGARMRTGAFGAVKYGAPLAASLAAWDAWGVAQDDGMTAAEKKLAYAGIAGGAGGSIGGAAVGGAIGALFGGVGAVPGALIGGAIGNLMGEAAGKAVARKVAGEQVKVGGDIRVSIDQDGRVTGVSARSYNRDVPLSLDNGLSMVAP